MGAVVPLTFEDMKDQLIQNGVGKSLVTMPLSLLGAGGSTYDRKPYENMVNSFKDFLRQYEEKRNDMQIDRKYKDVILEEMRQTHPLLKNEVRGRISALISQVGRNERLLKDLRKRGASDAKAAEIEARIEEGKKAVMEIMRQNR